MTKAVRKLQQKNCRRSNWFTNWFTDWFTDLRTNSTKRAYPHHIRCRVTYRYDRWVTPHWVIVIFLEFCFANNKIPSDIVACATKTKELSNLLEKEVRLRIFEGIMKESELRSRRTSLEQASLTIEHNLVENRPHGGTITPRWWGSKEPWEIRQALSSAWSRF